MPWVAVVKELWRWHINWVFQSMLMPFEEFFRVKNSGGPFLGRKISVGIYFQGWVEIVSILKGCHFLWKVYGKVTFSVKNSK